jgi:hypothetical protein
MTWDPLCDGGDYFKADGIGIAILRAKQRKRMYRCLKFIQRSQKSLYREPLVVNLLYTYFNV